MKWFLERSNYWFVINLAFNREEFVLHLTVVKRMLIDISFMGGWGSINVFGFRWNNYPD